MITVIKRSGASEEFSAEKIRNSLAVASDETNQPLNMADINMVVTDVARIIEGKTEIQAFDLYMVVLGILSARGFTAIRDSYVKSESNSWRKQATL